MRVLHFSTYDHLGGAARAALRLHEALRATGVESSMSVRRPFGRSAHVHGPARAWDRWAARLHRRIERLRTWNAGRRGAQQFSAGLSGLGIGDAVRRHQPDVIHLHWILDGFISLEQIAAIDLPMVWTYHDMWPFTGGCHFVGGCERYLQQCGACPRLDGREEHDLSRRVWLRKRQTLSAANIIGVAPSRWIAGRVRESSLWQGAQVHVVPNGLDLAGFSRADPAAARAALHLARDRVVVTTGAAGLLQDPRKGFDLFCTIAERLAAAHPSRYEFVLFGCDPPGDVTRGGVTFRNLGRVNDDRRLALIYGASDLFVASSREDNLPNTLVEALACGTPGAGFSIGGIPEIIDDGVSGVLAQPFDALELATRVDTLLGDHGAGPALRERARHKAEAEYSIHQMVERHRAIYEAAAATRR